MQSFAEFGRGQIVLRQSIFNGLDFHEASPHLQDVKLQS